MNTAESYVIGVDYGTDSVRSVLVNARNGAEVSSAVFQYPRWKDGLYCNAAENRFRQHPLDYIEGLEHTIKRCLLQAGPQVAAQVKALSVDTTGSTPIAVDETGTPLSLLPQFQDNPAAMFVLWKDHTAVAEATEINEHAQTLKAAYLQFVGGIYSSEWFWAKLLRILRMTKRAAGCYSFGGTLRLDPIFINGRQTHKPMKRSVCAAGHKSLWARCWGGLPPKRFFASLDPLLDGFTERLFNQV
jgi:L-ribulokinase